MKGARLEQVSEFKYLGCVFNKSGTEDAECCRKVASGRKVSGAIRSQANARGLQLECARLLHEGLLEPIMLYDSEIMIWREKMDNLRSFLGIRKYIEYRMQGLESYAE